MNPAITLEFSSLHELLVISIKLRDVYRSLSTDPIAEGDKEWERTCNLMANQMDCIAKEARAYLGGQMPDRTHFLC